jgi:hypothetical protein
MRELYIEQSDWVRIGWIPYALDMAFVVIMQFFATYRYLLYCK